MRCLICNEPIDGLVSRSLAISVYAQSRQVPPALMIHESCAREAAHASFDWQAVERARAELQAMVDQGPSAS